MSLFYFFLGIVIFQIIFTGIHFYIFRKKEFLYYMLFTLSITVFISGGVYPILDDSIDGVKTHRLLSPYNFFIPLSPFFYYKFIRYFIDSSQFYQKLDQQFKKGETIILSGTLLLLAAIFLTNYNIAYYYLVTLIAVISIFNIYLLVSLFKKKNKLTNIMVIGSFLLFTFARLAYFSGISSKKINVDSNDSVFTFSMWGLIFDFFFFNFSLIYKSRLIQNENIRLAVEKQIELNDQRLSISNDLHDDIGSSLSSIQLELALVANGQSAGKLPANERLMKMSEEVKLVLDNMNDIIWAVKRGASEEKSFSNRIKEYYYDLMDAKQVECTYKIDRALEARIRSSTVKKNLLLITKEAINNTLKHSAANKITLSLYPENDYLHLLIEDNGEGMPTQDATMGNGIESMKNRITQIGGNFDLKSVAGIGTTIACKVPLSKI